jgi:hypothetical protein
VNFDVVHLDGDGVSTSTDVLLRCDAEMSSDGQFIVTNAGARKWIADHSAPLIRYVLNTRKIPSPPFEFLMMMRTCRAYWQNIPSSKKYAQRQRLRDTYAIQIYFYFSDPDLSEPWVIDEEQQVLIVRGEDDYMNLCHKTYMMLSAVRTMFQYNLRLASVKGVLLMDDDISIIDTSKLYEAMKAHQDDLYWGNKAVCGQTSTHFVHKAKESQTINTTFQRYPMLAQYPVRTHAGNHCSGGTCYLHRNSVDRVLMHPELFQPFPKTEAELGTHLNKGVLDNLSSFEDVNVGAALRLEDVTPTFINVFDFVYWKRN